MPVARRRLLRVLWSVLAAVLAVGGPACATRVQGYPGPRRPDAEVAIVRAFPGGPVTAEAGEKSLDAWIVGYDGTPLDRPARAVDLLPGEHTVRVRWTRYVAAAVVYAYGQDQAVWKEQASGEETVGLDAVAGHRYTVA